MYLLPLLADRNEKIRKWLSLSTLNPRDHQEKNYDLIELQNAIRKMHTLFKYLYKILHEIARYYAQKVNQPELTDEFVLKSLTLNIMSTRFADRLLTLRSKLAYLDKYFAKAARYTGSATYERAKQFEELRSFTPSQLLRLFRDVALLMDGLTVHIEANYFQRKFRVADEMRRLYQSKRNKYLNAIEEIRQEYNVPRRVIEEIAHAVAASSVTPFARLSHQ